MSDSVLIEIGSRDYWFKVVGMLQQNWALVAPKPEGGVMVWFISDASGVFDRLPFDTEPEARTALLRNGFERLAQNEDAQGLLRSPSPPFHSRAHPNGEIYSSGRYWR